jgi:hypothetical protein
MIVKENLNKSFWVSLNVLKKIFVELYFQGTFVENLARNY